MFTVFTSILISFLFSSKPVSAVWVKYNRNPVFSGSVGGWDSSSVQDPSIIYEKGTYKMWYNALSSGWKIGFAYSADGKKDWQRSSTPVIDIGSTDGRETDTTDPFVLKSGEGYQMWYSSFSGSYWIVGEDRFRLRYATSAADLSWNKNSDWVLKGNSGKWDSGGMNRGETVIKVGDVYKMWYAAIDDKRIGSGTETWQIGYATSPDGINWTKNENPVISPTEEWELNSVNYPFVLYNGDKYEMWYAATERDLPKQIVYAYSQDGTSWIKPPDKNPVLTTGPYDSFDSRYIDSPYVIKNGGSLRMYYSGFDGSRWSIGMAEWVEPTPTPTPTIAPTPTPLQPLVLIPGLGASWNHEAMIFGTEKPQNQWRMTPGVKLYDGLIQTLKNAGYIENENLFIFNYDWRKPIQSIGEDLKNYITTKVKPPGGIDLLGHSLGGLVGRAYLQNNEDNVVDQLIQVGSPNLGAAKVYYLWEGGDLEKTLPGWQRIGAGLLLRINGLRFTSKIETIHNILPSLNDLFPVFPFLLENGNEKPLEEMAVKNNWLLGLNTSLPDGYLEQLHVLTGDLMDSTLRWIEVENRSWLEKILGLWPDGRPNGSQVLGEGDKTVLRESAEFGGNYFRALSADHGELVSSEMGQQKIIELLGLPIPEISLKSNNLNYEQYLVFQLASPATISIIDPNGNAAYSQDPQIVVVDNPVAGKYKVNLVGTDQGKFTLYIGQILPDKDYWSSILGTIKKDELLPLEMTFNPDTPLENPILDPSGKVYLTSAQLLLSGLETWIRQEDFNKLKKPALLAYLKASKILLQKSLFETTIDMLYRLRRQTDNFELKNKTQEIIEILDGIYITRYKDKIYNQKKLDQERENTLVLFNKFETDLKTLNTESQVGSIYLLAQQKLESANNGRNFTAHLRFLEVRHLSLEGTGLIK